MSNMAIQFKTLESTEIPELLEVFNSAFSDYALPMRMEEAIFIRKLFIEGVSLGFSAGAFDGDKLVGFILHGLDEFNGEKRVFNAATGVVQSHRGQRLAEQMYNYILPVLKAQGYRHHQLEVLNGNIKAERAYEKVGFRKSRDLFGYEGTVAPQIIPAVEIKEVKYLDWIKVQSFWDVQPAWQNHTPTVQRTMKDQKIIAAYVEGNLAGYLVYDTVNGRSKQFAVKKEYRRQGIGTALLANVTQALGKVNFVNYDDNDKGAKAFFDALGLKPNYHLHEMTLVYS